jgi:hypothetical protein
MNDAAKQVGIRRVSNSSGELGYWEIYDHLDPSVVLMDGVDRRALINEASYKGWIVVAEHQNW